MPQTIYDNDELSQALADHIDRRARSSMPAPVQVQIIDGSMQFETGWVWGQVDDRNVRVIVFAPSDYTSATAANPITVHALPPNDNSPTSPYFALGVAYVGTNIGGFGLSRVPPIVATQITNPTGGSFGGTGTVTSVAMTVPAIMGIAGSPITTSGTLALSMNSEAANIVLAGPTGGGAATPAFRSLVAADIPALSYVTSVALTVPSFLSVAGSPITSAGTLAVSLTNENANTVLAGPTSGGATTPAFRTLVAADIPPLDDTLAWFGIFL